MLIIKKRRYKPLYKKFLNLKQNAQNRQRLLKFKKRKWQKLIEYLKRINDKYPRKFRLYDHNRYFLSKFSDSFKNKFRYNLQTKQRFSYFYGGLSVNYLKTVIKSASKKSKLNKKVINSKFFFVEFLESRLDTILYRSHFVPSIRNARQLISHKHVFVNKKIVKNKGFLVQRGDLIEVSPTIQNLIENCVKSSNIWPIPPKYLLINYRTFQILFTDDIKSTNLSTNFPFWLDLNAIMKYYER